MPKIKILYVLTSLCTGGIERNVIDISNNLSQDIFDVTLLVLTNNFNDMQQYVCPHIKLRFLPIKYRKLSFLNIFSLFLAIPLVIYTIEKIKPEIIHTHNFLFIMAPFFIAQCFYIKKAKHFHTIHTTEMHYDKKTNKDKLKLSIERLFYKTLKTTIVYVSPYLYFCSKNIFKSIKTTALIPNGVNLGEFYQNENDIFKHKLVYVARIVEGKGHKILLKAFSMICKTNSDIQLLLLGDGELMVEMKVLVNTLGINKSVVFTGNCIDVPSVLRQCTIGVFPSESEGFSIALIEMMATGLPVVCSDIPAFTSFLTDQEDVIFFKLNDIDDLVSKITSLIDSRVTYEKLAQASLAIAQKYSMNEMMKKYTKIYKESIL